MDNEDRRGPFINCCQRLIVMKKNLNRYNLVFLIKLVVILISFCVFNNTVYAANLSSLTAIGYESDLTPSFDPNTYEYSINYAI